MHNKYEFKNLVLSTGIGSMYHVTLPSKESEDIKFLFSEYKEAWGSIKVRVSINETVWNTSIFPDNKRGGYFLPIKLEVRKAEHLEEGDKINITVKILTH